MTENKQIGKLESFTKGNKTPAEVAGIKAPVRNWTELVRKVGGI